MESSKDNEPINLEHAVQEEAELADCSRFEIRIDAVNHVIDDPIVTGNQLLNLADKRPHTEFLIYQFLRDGSLEGIRPEETVDLRTRGVERFITFESTAAYFFLLDDIKKEWGAARITGRQLKRLAGVDVKKYDVWQEKRGAEDQKIEDREMVDLSKDGLERFYTAINQTTEGLVGGQSVLPAADRRFLDDHKLDFEICEDRNQKGVVFPDYRLPVDLFDQNRARLLILLPQNYPSAAPDMFFADPWVTLKGTGRYPSRADVPFEFVGTRWQRWSRHNNEWRRGTDGIHTILARVNRALTEAK